MTYKERYESAQKSGKAEELTRDIHTWHEEGQELIGECIAVQKFEGGKFDTTCNEYRFRTDDGIVSTILGGAIDKQLESKKIKGRVLYIRYRGKGQLDDGRQFNKFTVKDITNA